MEKDKLDIQPGFNNLSSSKKVLYVIWGVFMFVSFFIVVINEVYTAYPGTIKGQEEAKNVAKDFTVALSGRNYNEAHKLLSPVTQRLMNTPESLGANRENSRPISGSWKGYEDEYNIVYGTIKFEDDKDMSAEISMKWLNGQFRITGANFWDSETDDSRMSFSSCCDKSGYFDWIYWIAPSLR